MQKFGSNEDISNLINVLQWQKFHQTCNLHFYGESAHRTNFVVNKGGKNDAFFVRPWTCERVWEGDLCISEKQTLQTAMKIDMYATFLNLCCCHGYTKWPFFFFLGDGNYFTIWVWVGWYIKCSTRLKATKCKFP